MLPFLGQGACQAIEDAVAIGSAIAEHGAVPGALRAYERARRKRATMLVRRSRTAGRVANLRSAWQRGVRDAVVRRTPDRPPLPPVRRSHRRALIAGLTLAHSPRAPRDARGDAAPCAQLRTPGRAQLDRTSRDRAVAAIRAAEIFGRLPRHGRTGRESDRVVEVSVERDVGGH